jgi:murein DD-endopeptidase MepM/ murein hydrolase activator NlpD
MKKQLFDMPVLEEELNHDDAASIIEDELNSYITRKKEQRARIIRMAGLSTMAVLLIYLAVLFVPVLYQKAAAEIAFLQTSEIERVLNSNAAVIRTRALEQNPATPFDGYQFASGDNLPAETRYAALLHRFSNDFYGKGWGLSRDDEMLLFTWANMAGFNSERIGEPDRVFNVSDNIPLQEWLRAKLEGKPEEKPYFNPVFSDLALQEKLISEKYTGRINAFFNENELEALRRMIVTNNLSDASNPEIVTASVNFLAADASRLETERALQKKLIETRQERDLRLLLFHLALGYDYGLRRENEVFGWLAADYKGRTAMSQRRLSDELEQLREILQPQYDQFKEALVPTRLLYQQLNFDEWEMEIRNPIRIGLQVKDVGLFGARRKSDRGNLYEHRGIDLMADRGTPVYPVQAGFVVYVGNDDNGHGNHIEIWHDDRYYSVYSHLDGDDVFRATRERFKKEGPFWVGSEAQIASVGMSGNIPRGDEQYGYAHLHLEVRQGNHYANPFLLFHENFKVLH